MHIVCPHCTTSYAVNPATFGQAGRTVRCARCKETWHAQPESLARAEERAPAMASATAEDEDLSGWGLSDDRLDGDTPMVDSPPITSSMPRGMAAEDADWSARADDARVTDPEPNEGFDQPAATGRKSWVGKLGGLTSSLSFNRIGTRSLKASPFKTGMLRISLGSACAGMAAMVMALIFWRGDVVRLQPQTAAFYKMVGLDVNLRNLAFRDVKVTNENVDGKSVLVIEGLIIGEGRKQQIDLPRLRFVVRDDKGTEIYAWNAVLDQTALKSGETAWFRSRLASPPADSRSIDVRFYNKRDIGARGA